MSLPVIEVTGRRPLPPRVTPFSERFWSGLDRGRFETTRCDSCQRLTFPPTPICRACGSQAPRWVPLSGRAKLYSCTVVHAAPSLFSSHAPYPVAIVDLEEGVRLVAGVLPNTAVPGLDDPCELVVTRYEDGPLFAVRGIE